MKSLNQHKTNGEKIDHESDRAHDQSRERDKFRLLRDIPTTLKVKSNDCARSEKKTNNFRYDSARLHKPLVL